MDGGLPVGLPANLPSIAHARLPAAYEAAKSAIAVAAGIDECREWADKMEAIASYARQADDDALLNHAMRIKARAVQRCGELLREIPAGKPGPKSEALEGPQLASAIVADAFAVADGRFAAGRAAKLSTKQIKTALRVANVPKEEFEARIEASNPPTVTELADIGRQKRPAPPPTIDHLQGRNPGDFEQATRLLGLLRFVNEKIPTIDLAAAARGANEAERKAAANSLAAAGHWFASALEKLGHAL